MAEKISNNTQRVPKSFFISWEQYYDNLEVEDVACALCGSNNHVSMGREHIFEIRKCLNCGLVYVSPQPTSESLAAFYETYYGDIEAPRSFGDFETHIKHIIRARCPDGGRLLDVGCGLGTFLHYMSDDNWELYGVDLSEKALEVARRVVPEATLTISAFEDDFHPQVQFDCVTLIAVLEHTKDPRRTLSNIISKLRPGGVLIVQVPYILAFFRLSRRFPFLPRVTFETPRHLFDFSPATLQHLMAECGLEKLVVDVARPYCGQNNWVRMAIWMIKIPGILLRLLSGGRYIYPFAGAIVVHGVKPEKE